MILRIADASPSSSAILWQAATRMLEPEIDLVKSAWDELPLQWSRFLLVIELGQDSADEASIIEQSEDPFRITTTATRPSSRTNVYTERIVHYWDQGGQWQDVLRIAAKQQVRIPPSPPLTIGLIWPSEVCTSTDADPFGFQVVSAIGADCCRVALRGKPPSIVFSLCPR